MKKGRGVLIIVFLTGMILGTMQPAMLFAGETGGGDIWDQFVDPKPYPGIWLQGPLSIYYEYLYDDEGNQLICDLETGDPAANMFYTVRLNKVVWFDFKSVQTYTFQGTMGTCLNDWEFQGNVIKEFLGTVVVPGIFPGGFSSWKVKSIEKAQYHDDDFSRAFVADIVIAVKR
jgi:hypothetical protein